MIRRTAIVLVLAGLVSGCGISTTQPFPHGPVLSNNVEAVPLYFTLGDVVYPTSRPGDRDTPAQRRLDLLTAGPTEAEAVAGLTTALPSGVRLRLGEDKPVDRRLRVVAAGIAPAAILDIAKSQIACTLVAAFATTETPVEIVVLQAEPGRDGEQATCQF